MSEPNPKTRCKYDFDTMVVRENTGNMKFLTTPEAVLRAGNISYSGAEMDFKTSPSVIDAIVRRAKGGLFGFTLCDETYIKAVRWWMKNQRGWDVKKEWIVATYGTIHSVATAIRAFTEVGDGIIIQPPVYHRYQQAIRRTNRVAIMDPLKYRNGQYEIDFENLARCMSDPRAKLMVICNPHNPVGRVWTEGELSRIAELAERYNVIVFSDEIFAEVVFDGHFTVPYSEVPRAAARCIVSTSLGKTFNLTGFNNANLIIPDAGIRERFRVQRDSDHFGSIDPLVHAAVCGAYTPEGADWVREMLKYVRGNLTVIQEYFAHLPQVKLCDVEGTYVLWMDWRELGFDDDALYDFLVNEAYLCLDPGIQYGPGGSGFMRMNVATTRAALRRSLATLLRAAEARGYTLPRNSESISRGTKG